MDITNIISELRLERERLDGIISALERLGASGQVTAGPKRRGRKFMDKAGRLEVSERMKRYWASRRDSVGNHSYEARSAAAGGGHGMTASDSDNTT
jgi:hypothetical protein